MIQITHRAVEGLKRLLSASGAPDDQGIKLVAAETGGVGMTIAPPTEGDAVFEGGEERPLLIVDAPLVEGLEGTMLDLTSEDGPDPEFVIRREDLGSPN
jgi:Fe-S cluster assembly iron-binding protein IscA